MAKNYRGEGTTIDFNGLVDTGTTITAGTLVWVDSANVVHPMTSVPATAAAESSAFAGVMGETLTALHTGVMLYTRGVFMFRTTATITGVINIGEPVWAGGPDVVRTIDADNTGKGLTGRAPIGVCVGFPGAPHTSGAGVNLYVKIFPNRCLPILTSVGGYD